MSVRENRDIFELSVMTRDRRLVQDWIAACIVQEPGAFCPSGTYYPVYAKFARGQGVTPISERQLLSFLEESFPRANHVKKRAMIGGVSKPVWGLTGLKIVQNVQKPPVPSMAGMQTVQQARSANGTSTTPAIAVNRSVSADNVPKVPPYGMTGFIAKKRIFLWNTTTTLITENGWIVTHTTRKINGLHYNISHREPLTLLEVQTMKELRGARIADSDEIKRWMKAYFSQPGVAQKNGQLANAHTSP